MKHCFFLALCGAAALVPLVSRTLPAARPIAPPWPETYEGAPLQPVRSSAAELAFHASFPGAIARFTDGRRELIFRWTALGTRKLHPGADCFRGLGYTVTPEPPVVDPHGARWSCFLAARDVHRLRVRERIASTVDGQSWTDVSAWYWSTLLRSTEGPWVATTIAEAE
jgi:hypothetical protein